MTGPKVRDLANILLLLTAGTLLAACGGGEEPGQSPPGVPPGSASVLAWEPPANYSDNTSLDPYLDLDCYEIYLRQDVNFGDADLPTVQVAAVAEVVPADGSLPRKDLVREFVLQNLGPFVTKGRRYFVSIRAVGTDGQKSGFMTPVPWDFV